MAVLRPGVEQCYVAFKLCEMCRKSKATLRCVMQQSYVEMLCEARLCYALCGQAMLRCAEKQGYVKMCCPSRLR